MSHDGICWVWDSAWVYGNVRVSNDAQVFGDARVYGNVWVSGDTRIFGGARLEKPSDYLTVFPIGSRNGATTFFKTAGGKIFVKCGCFEGDIERFAAKVRETHGDNRHAKAYLAAIELAKIQIEPEDVPGSPSQAPQRIEQSEVFL